MKPHSEMIEGPEALDRFQATMKTLFTAKKTPAKAKTPKPSAKSVKKN